jgi:bacillopeptidase F (M6 metalloprotease family)
LHPHLDHYQTETANGLDCTPSGTTGLWNAASGNSNGWQQWAIDPGAYEGESVEISIAYASDWAVQNLGVFIDDVTLPDGTSTSFEAGLDGWVVSGPAEGNGSHANDWNVTDAGASRSAPRSRRPTRC